MGYHLTARTSAAANANEGGQEKKEIHLSITENLSALHRDQAILVRSPGGSPLQKQPGQPLLQNQSAISTPPPVLSALWQLGPKQRKTKKGKFFNVVSHLWPFMANSHGGGQTLYADEVGHNFNNGEMECFPKWGSWNVPFLVHFNFCLSYI